MLRLNGSLFVLLLTLSTTITAQTSVADGVLVLPKMTVSYDAAEDRERVYIEGEGFLVEEAPLTLASGADGVLPKEIQDNLIQGKKGN